MRAVDALLLVRPGFLSVTAVGWLLGTVHAVACGKAFDAPRAFGALVLALMAHAAANLLNDVHDARSGADAANTQAVRPFTGGAGYIQRGLITADEVAAWARTLLALVVLGGLLLASVSGGAVLGLGMAGLALGWAYSAPPLQLMHRGLGELAVAAAWALLVVGADAVLRGSVFVIPVWLGVGYAATVAAILVVNGLPDAPSDAAVGKRTLVVRLGPEATAVLHAALGLFAAAWLWVGVALWIPPAGARWGLVALPLSLWASAQVWRHRRRPQALRPAIVATIAAALLYGVATAAGVSWGGF